jgi:hypothetical protein
MPDTPSTIEGCTVCTRPCSGAWLCRSCTDQLVTELRQVPGLVRELTITLTRQARVGGRNGPRSSERPLVFHWGASVDLESLRDGLAMWCSTIAEQRGIQVDADRTPTDLARWLTRWVGEAAQHPDAAELHGDVLALTRAARKTIDLAPQLRYVGPCDGHRASVQPAAHNGCQLDLYVWPSATVAICATEGCGAEYLLEHRRGWLLEQAYDRLLTAAEMSRAIRELVPGQEITPNRISQWAARGRLTKYLPHPRDPHHRVRFRVQDVIEAAQGSGEGHVNGAA